MKKHFKTYGALYVIILSTLGLGLVSNDSFWCSCFPDSPDCECKIEIIKR